MFRRLVSASMVMAVCLSATSAVHASPFTRSRRADATKAINAKQVTVALRNNTGQPMKVIAGGQEFSLAPHQTTMAKLNVGDKLIANSDTPASATGTLLAEVSRSLNHATLILN